jgi:adenylyltransferase/sulfurtransferase
MMATRARSPGEARFVVIGAGGLGGPILYALAAAGAGELCFFDDDVVDLSNLQRQVQFTTADIGRTKAEAMAAELVRRGTPRTRIVGSDERFTAARAGELVGLQPARTVVIDGSDNFATKFAVNDACVAADLPFVIAGVLRAAGQVLSVRSGRDGCYRCLFEAAPDDDDAASCAAAGVLGAAVAVVAGAAAQRALALATAEETASAAADLLVFEDLTHSARPRRVGFQRRPDCPAHGPEPRRAS